MQGMNRDTGKLLTDEAHLRQSIRMILTTPLRTRVMRPEFGSEVPRLIAAPMTAETELRIYAATIDALAKWEPRIEVQQVQIVERSANGVLTLEISGIYNSERIQTRITLGSTSSAISEIPLDPSIPGTVPETPLDPSTPITPEPTRDYNSFGFDDGKRFVFDSGKEFIWRS